MGRSATRRTDRGAVALTTALVTCCVLFVVAALTVDMGNAMARHGQLQHQVDRAAKLAAQQLPVDTPVVGGTPSDSQLAVAEAAAYYLACHPVPGQDASLSLPECPADGDYRSDPEVTAYARALLTNGRTVGVSDQGEISFPHVNEVELVGPRAQVDFEFGAVAGADGTSASRTARAIVLSPGEVLPVGLSVSCLASALGAAPLGAGDTVSTVVPAHYVSTGHPTPPSDVSLTPPLTPDVGDTYFGDLEINQKAATVSIDFTRSVIKPNGEVTLHIDYSSSKFGFSIERLEVHVRRDGYQLGDQTGYYVLDYTPSLLDQSKQTGTAVFTGVIPSGDYETLVYVQGRNLQGGGGTQTWMDNKHVEFTVPVRGALANLVTCARPVQSPRLGIAGEADAMAVNLAQGLDHPLAAFPGLGDAVDGVSLPPGTAVASVAGLLAAADSAFRCDSNSRVRMDYPSRRTDGANCVRVDTRQDWAEPLTRGLLTGGTVASGGFAGRLRCPTTGRCNHSASRPVLSNPGGITGSYNNDRFSDFVTTGSSLDPFRMSLDALISPSLPLVTPPSTGVDEALYASPRFFWAPVVLTTYATSSPGAAGDYSILSFRPVFLTSENETDATASSVDTLLLGLVESARASGYALQSALKNFVDANLHPCAGTGLTVSQLLSSILLSSTQVDACQRELLKTPVYSSTGAADTTVARLVHRFLGGNVALSDGSNTESFGGLVIDRSAGRVRAARIMTIAPGALPAVAHGYSGPTAPYVGVGPKIVRLTK